MSMVSPLFKTKESFRFCHQLLLKLSRVREKRNKKKKDFYFLIFQTFGKLEKDFDVF